MTELYNSRLSSGKTLAAALTTTSPSLTLSSAPSGVAAGTYRLRIDGEVMTGDYSGTGITFTNLARGLEGTSAATHRSGVLVRHVITGESLEELRRSSVQVAHQQISPYNYVRPPGLRMYLASNFT